MGIFRRWYKIIVDIISGGSLVKKNSNSLGLAPFGKRLTYPKSDNPLATATLTNRKSLKNVEGSNVGYRSNHKNTTK